MANLIAKPALDGAAPLEMAGTVLALGDWVQITSIAPFAGREAQVSAALAPLGLGFPAPNSFARQGDAHIVWTGRAQAFLLGADCPDLGDLAAVTDQSDAWVRLQLAGPAAADALARYVPMDLRSRAFPPGAAARTMLYHMPLCLWREDAQAFTLLTFRSMARTAWHELGAALKVIAARQK